MLEIKTEDENAGNFISAVKLFLFSKILRNARICCPILLKRRKNLGIVSPHISCRSDVPQSTVKTNSFEKILIQASKSSRTQTSVLWPTFRAKFSSTRSIVVTIPLSLALNAKSVGSSQKLLSRHRSSIPRQSSRITQFGIFSWTKKTAKTFLATTTNKKKKRKAVEASETRSKSATVPPLPPSTLDSLSKTIFTISFPLTKLSMHLTIHVLCCFPSPYASGALFQARRKQIYRRAWFRVRQAAVKHVMQKHICLALENSLCSRKCRGMTTLIWNNDAWHVNVGYFEMESWRGGILQEKRKRCDEYLS